MATKVAWPRPKVYSFSKDNPTGHREREKEKETDSKRGGKTISKSGQEWTLAAQLGQLKQDKVERIVANSSVVPRRPSKVMG